MMTRMLIVEDNLDIVNPLLLILEAQKKGYEVHHARTLEQAMQMLEHVNYTVVVSDQHTPGSDETGTSIAKLLQGSATKVILYSHGWTEDAEAEATQLVEAEHVLAMPGDATSRLPFLIDKYMTAKEHARPPSERQAR